MSTPGPSTGFFSSLLHSSTFLFVPTKQKPTSSTIPASVYDPSISLLQRFHPESDPSLDTNTLKDSKKNQNTRQPDIHSVARDTHDSLHHHHQRALCTTSLVFQPFDASQKCLPTFHRVLPRPQRARMRTAARGETLVTGMATLGCPALLA